MNEYPINKRRVCIVGGAGFIGHNLALTMHERGAEVCVIDGLEVNNLVSLTANLDNVPNPRLSLLFVNERLRLLREAGIQIVVQDARDYHAISRLIGELRPHALVHLAAVSHAGRSNKNPFSTFDHSLRTLENALDAARENVDHFIYFSSSMVYGDFDGDVVWEDRPCDPMGIYGALKFCGETITRSYNQVFGLPYTIIRPSALYGERCVSRRVGQVFIENAIAGRDIVVNGDGSSALDFTYIEDLCAAVIRTIECDEARDQTLNVTYGDARPISALIDILRAHFPNINVRYEDKEALMPERGTLSVNKARDLLGYEPRWPLEEGYDRYIRWYKEFCAANPTALT